MFDKASETLCHSLRFFSTCARAFTHAVFVARPILSNPAITPTPPPSRQANSFFPSFRYQLKITVGGRSSLTLLTGSSPHVTCWNCTCIFFSFFFFYLAQSVKPQSNESLCNYFASRVFLLERHLCEARDFVMLYIVVSLGQCLAHSRVSIHASWASEQLKPLIIYIIMYTLK